MPHPLPLAGAQHSFSVMPIPWTRHKRQAEDSFLQCVFDHERSQKLGRRSPSFTLYSQGVWRTICPIWAIYCVNLFPGSAAGPRRADARWFCPLGMPSHLAGATPLLRLLLYTLFTGCTRIKCLYRPAFTSRRKGVTPSSRLWASYPW